jgi:pilus assembly protein CpaF
VTSIHRQIATAVDLIVQAARLRDGRRVVSQVSEVVGVDPDTNRAVLRDLFHFEDDVEQLRPTGHLPTFMAELMARDLINLDAFYP